MHKILVCGGRNYADKVLFDAIMLRVMFGCNYRETCIIEGGATGADGMAKAWGKHRGIAVLSVDANWEFYGRYMAGPIRNTWMLTFCKPDIVVAFPGGAGTANMVIQAGRILIPVFKVDPNGPEG